MCSGFDKAREVQRDWTFNTALHVFHALLRRAAIAHQSEILLSGLLLLYKQVVKVIWQ